MKFALFVLKNEEEFNSFFFSSTLLPTDVCRNVFRNNLIYHPDEAESVRKKNGATCLILIDLCLSRCRLQLKINWIINDPGLLI